MNISGKVKEAETYYEMGLFEESLSVYEKILYKIDEPELSQIDSINRKINEIRTKIDPPDQDHKNSVSPEEIVFFKKALAISEDITDRMDSAAVFMESGLYKEAVEEYDKVLCPESSWESIISDLATCLVKGYESSEIVGRIEEMIAPKRFEDKDKFAIAYQLGQEIEKMDEEEIAFALYQYANRLDPENKNIIETSDSDFAKDSMPEEDIQGFVEIDGDNTREKSFSPFIEFADNPINLINKTALEKKEREFIGSIKAALDWKMIKSIFTEEYQASITNFVDCQQGDFIVYNNSVAYQLDFEIKMPFSIVIDRGGDYQRIACTAS